MAIILIGDEFRQWLIKNIKQFKNYKSRVNGRGKTLGEMKYVTH